MLSRKFPKEIRTYVFEIRIVRKQWIKKHFLKLPKKFSQNFSTWNLILDTHELKKKRNILIFRENYTLKFEYIRNRNFNNSVAEKKIYIYRYIKKQTKERKKTDYFIFYSKLSRMRTKTEWE